ncbi:sulfatase family protein [Lignipirellula cremea]|uniref:Arylsulfatase n=1 Tax=Lignipirellula cremea TaxID=2528010 RepID=A0A518E4T1_9BACT|nr:sulfatase [Lignipirellula cremea]QDU99084.1 Arylsulfatase [Lignipirellula cremea]
MKLPLWFLLVALAAVGGTSLGAAERNVVLFVTDDQSPDMGCYGNDTIQTPHLDALAADGVRFNHAFCTTASCSASRSVILTGIYNHANAQFGHEHSYHHFRTYDHIKSLPVLMAAAGYRTARIGKYHVGPEAVYHFEKTLPGDSRNAVQMANNCREFLSDDDKRPFFLYFCTSDPHRSGGEVPGDPYKPNPFGNKPNGYPGVTPIKYDPDKIRVHSFLPDTPTCRHELAQYYQSVSRIDQGMGRLVALLKESGHYDDTMILFTADHGIAFPGGKTTLYEGGMRIPLLVRQPYGEAQDTQCNALVNLADLTPTILDFAGALPKKHDRQGRSFLAALQEESPAGWDEVYASHTFHEITMYYPMRVVRDRQLKLIWNLAHQLPYPFASDLWAAPTWQDRYKQGPDTYYGPRTVHQYIHRPKFELYDIQADPDEAKNLIEDPQYADQIAAMKKKIKAFQAKTKDPWILKWDYE